MPISKRTIDIESKTSSQHRNNLIIKTKRIFNYHQFQGSLLIKRLI